MTEPILEESYWRDRLAGVNDINRHHAIFKCPLDQWQRIEEKHRDIIRGTIHQYDSVLDAGCGWGRLLSLMPNNWRGDYLGVDFSPDFISLAGKEHPRYEFVTGDLRHLDKFMNPSVNFDWGILVSIRPMVIRNLSQEFWDQMEEQLRRVCVDLLFLEYDEEDEGSIS